MLVISMFGGIWVNMPFKKCTISLLVLPVWATIVHFTKIFRLFFSTVRLTHTCSHLHFGATLGSPTSYLGLIP